MNLREWSILIAGVALFSWIVWDSWRLNRRLQIRQRLAEQNKAVPVGTWLARRGR